MTEADKNSGNLSEPSVGYRRPPVHSRFKKGQTGNPGGLPRKNPNGLLSLLRAKLAQQYGKSTKTYAEVLVDQWLKEALGQGTSSRKLV